MIEIAIILTVGAMVFWLSFEICLAFIWPPGKWPLVDLNAVRRMYINHINRERARIEWEAYKLQHGWKGD